MVGDALSVADLLLFAFMVYQMKCALSAEWRAAHPNITAWFEGVHANKVVSKYYGKLRYPAQPWW